MATFTHVYVEPALSGVNGYDIVETWWALAADPNYASLPPVTSVSTTATVTGTVEPEPPARRARSFRSSWGR